jgi:hypothetical protein
MLVKSAVRIFISNYNVNRPCSRLERGNSAAHLIEHKPSEDDDARHTEEPRNTVFHILPNFAYSIGCHRSQRPCP